MRNALVVLVPVCIGLSSGFIVPSSIQEITKGIQNDKRISKRNSLGAKQILQKDENFIKKANNTSNNISTSKDINIEKINNDIYEYIIKKGANLTERSFIYIKNQRSRISGERYNRKNKDKSYIDTLSNIFDEIHRRFSLGYVEKNMFNTRKIFDASGHRCKGKSNFATNINNKKFKDQEELIFGIPVNLYDLENQNDKEYDTPLNDNTEKDTRETSPLHNFNRINLNKEKRLHREPDSSKQQNQNKINNTIITDIHKTFYVPSNENSESDEEGDEILDYLINKALEDPTPKNKNYVIQNGFHYCRDCIEDNLNNPSPDTNCTCDYKKI